MSAKDILSQARKAKRNHLLEPEAKAFLASYGATVTKEKVAVSAEEAAQAAGEIGFPIVAKVVSPDILHKTEANCVKVNLGTPEEVKGAFQEIMANAKAYNANARIEGVLLARMVNGGEEVIIGLTTDPTFGKVVMFGLGGIWVEVMKDVSFRVVPLSRLDARDMIEEIKGYPLLTGIRGKAPKDIDALCDLLVQVSKLAKENEEIGEMDLNPVFVQEKGAIIADARIILKE
jgi:acetate---CoA ligase (ADP-forming) subunit beta